MITRTAGGNNHVNTQVTTNKYTLTTDGTIKIGTLNVCGLKSRINYPEFTDLINKYKFFFCVTEIKLDNTDIIFVPDYEYISKPREESPIRKSGGIAVFIHNDFLNFIETLKSICE